MLLAVLHRWEMGMLAMLKVKANLVAVTLLLQAFFIITTTIHFYKLENIDGAKGYLFHVNLALLLTGLTLLSLKEIEEMRRRRMETKLLKKHLEQVEELVNILHSQKHEHARHLQMLQAMLHLNEFKKAAEYIEGIAENCPRTGETMVQLGHPVLTAMLNSRKKIAEAKGIDFAFSIKCDLSELTMKPWDFCSLIGNLLDNALEAVLLNRGEKQVGLEIKREENYHVVYVYNNGPNVSPDKKEKIFSPGYTTKDSLARGYGLYLLKKMVEGYGGRVAVVSAEKTTFVVYLPIERHR